MFHICRLYANQYGDNPFEALRTNILAMLYFQPEVRRWRVSFGSNCMASASRGQVSTQHGSNDVFSLKRPLDVVLEAPMAQAASKRVVDVLTMYGACQVDQSSRGRQPPMPILPLGLGLPAAPDSHLGKKTYSRQLKKWQGSKQEWLDSQLRMDCILAMSKAEVIKRRFETYRPDLFSWDAISEGWHAKP